MEELLRCGNYNITKKVAMKILKLSLDLFQHNLTLVLKKIFCKKKKLKKCNSSGYCALLASIANANNIYTQDDSL